MSHERVDVDTAMTKWWNVKPERREAVPEIVAKAPAGRLDWQVPIGSGQDADIGLQLLGGSQSFEAAGLYDAEELGLSARRGVANLV